MALTKRELWWWIIIFFIVVPVGTPEDVIITIPIINFLDKLNPGYGMHIYLAIITIFLIILFSHLKNNGMTFKGFFNAGKKLIKL